MKPVGYVGMGMLAVACCWGCSSGSFDVWDRDGDGQLSADEVPQKYREQFDGADLDGDGWIARVEYESARDFLVDAHPRRRFHVLRNVPYADSADPRQQLNLFIPKAGTGPFPLIVYIHGGAWLQGNKERGVVLLSPFLRGGDYAGASIGYRLSGQATWPAQLYDCKAALRWLRANAAKYNIDPDRIAVFGSSAGGHLASMLGLTADEPEWNGHEGAHRDVSTRVRCVVTYCGPSDLVELALSTNSIVPPDPTNSPVARLMGGPIADRMALTRQASPVYHAKAGVAPFLIAQGTKDRVVPFDQSVRLNRALLEAGATPLFIPLIDADHIFISKELAHRTRQFFDLHLRGIESEIRVAPIPP